MEREFYFRSCTGQEVYAKKWIREDVKEYKAVVQLVHGMQEHIGRYDEFANFLADCGYVVVGHDHLGHGNTAKSEEELGYFAKENGWSKLVEDVHILQNQIKEEYPELPYVIMGHSMGSLVVRTYIAKYQDKLDGVILSGTSRSKTRITGRTAFNKMYYFIKRRKI